MNWWYLSSVVVVSEMYKDRLHKAMNEPLRIADKYQWTTLHRLSSEVLVLLGGSCSRVVLLDCSCTLLVGGAMDLVGGATDLHGGAMDLVGGEMDLVGGEHI